HLAANRWWTGSADPVIRLILGLRARGHAVRLGVVSGDRFEAKAREAGLDLLDGLALDTGFAPIAAVSAVRRLGVLVGEGVGGGGGGGDTARRPHRRDQGGGGARAAVGGPGARGGGGPSQNRRSLKRGRGSRWLYRRTAAVFAVSRQIETRTRDVGIAAERVF